MMEKWLSASFIAQLLGLTNRAVRFRAARESWSYRTFEGNGGKHPRYHIADLPEDIQLAYAASLKTSLKELQDQLKPAPKPIQKVVIPAEAPAPKRSRHGINARKMSETSPLSAGRSLRHTTRRACPPRSS
jgi:hypothetical protein